MERAGRTVFSTIAWLVLGAIAGIIVARTQYNTDLSAFLPRAPSANQQLLVDQLRDGFASRLIIVGVEGATATVRAKLSVDMARRLRAGTQLLSVQNGDTSALDRERRLLFAHRYLLSGRVTPERFSATGLRESIQDTLDLLASSAGLLVKPLLPSDPTGEMIEIVSQMSGGRPPHTYDGVWTSADEKRALLLVQTRAQGSDTDGQERALAALRGAFAFAVAQSGAAASGATLQMSGPGVFSAHARASIKAEVTRLSIVSTVLIALLLLAVYRSFPALVGGLVPVASGALAGVAAVALGFGRVYGITLGFGVTLIGESVDYSIYLFVQSQTARDRQWPGALWPTIWLGVLTSMCGFASLLPSGFPGLSQLGLFSLAGLLAAALTTRFVLPRWMPQRLAIRDLTALGTGVARMLRHGGPWRALLALIPIWAAITLYVHWDTLWNRELSALSPVSIEDQRVDAQLRGDIGAPDLRYLVIVSGHDAESVLRDSERVAARLSRLEEAGALAGFDTPTRYLPSRLTQTARRASLPEPVELRARLREALQGLPLQLDRLQPFLHDVETARTGPFLTRSDLQGTTLAAGVDALLLRDGQRWTALLPLRATEGARPLDIAMLRSEVARAAPLGALVLDIKSEADSLYSTYLHEAVRLSLIGFVCIVVLLLIALRSVVAMARVMTPLALAVLAVAAGLVQLGHQLTILHVIGMLLIVAVGSNYALFFERTRRESAGGSLPLILASLVVANAATVTGFGVLATSSVPVLAALGQTVAPGALLALLFSALLAPPLERPA
ncbi:MAG TPA: MMPL family transporter [Steroidobacteraceae bacterium]|nr:MMPL family transporter [Steroidobacteraceae bacterium]